MLTLPIKKKWFNMIFSGEKKEEYREIKPYYDTRFQNTFGVIWLGNELLQGEDVPKEIRKDAIQEIRFRNGYGSSCPSFIAKCSLEINTGKEEWGAEPKKEYYVLKIHDIVGGKNL